MSETIKVKILPDGVTAKEVNELEEPPMFIWNGVRNERNPIFDIWELKRRKLRTFTIVNKIKKDPELPEDMTRCVIGKGKYTYLSTLGSTHSAEILDKDKLTIRIL